MSGHDPWSRPRRPPFQRDGRWRIAVPGSTRDTPSLVGALADRMAAAGMDIVDRTDHSIRLAPRRGLWPRAHDAIREVTLELDEGDGTRAAIDVRYRVRVQRSVWMLPLAFCGSCTGSIALGAIHWVPDAPPLERMAIIGTVAACALGTIGLAAFNVRMVTWRLRLAVAHALRETVRTAARDEVRVGAG